MRGFYFGGKGYGDRQEKAKERGLDIEEKLDAAKAEWAETAVSDPDTARRQLRAFWGIVGTVAGALIGLGVGYLMWGF